MATVATDTAADLFAAFREEVRGWIAEHLPPTRNRDSVESEMSLNPTRFLTTNGGFTPLRYSDTQIGKASDLPLDPALRRLPEAQRSYPPRTVATAAVL